MPPASVSPSSSTKSSFASAFGVIAEAQPRSSARKPRNSGLPAKRRTRASTLASSLMARVLPADALTPTNSAATAGRGQRRLEPAGVLHVERAQIDQREVVAGQAIALRGRRIGVRRARRLRRRRRRQRMHGDAPVLHLAPAVVALQRERALADLLQRRRQAGDLALGLEVVDDQRVVDVDADARPLHPQLQREPLVVAGQRLVGVADAVEAAGLLVLDVGGAAVAREDRLVVVHLHLEALLRRPALVHPGGVEVDAGVGAGVGEHLELGLEIGELRLLHRPDVEEVRALAVAGQRAVLDRPRVRVLAAFQPFSVAPSNSACHPGFSAFRRARARRAPAITTAPRAMPDDSIAACVSDSVGRPSLLETGHTSACYSSALTLRRIDAHSPDRRARRGRRHGGRCRRRHPDRRHGRPADEVGLVHLGVGARATRPNKAGGAASSRRRPRRSTSSSTTRPCSSRAARRIAPHTHKNEELIIVKEGAVEAYVNGEWKPAPTGSLIFFASMVPHTVRNTGTVPARTTS